MKVIFLFIDGLGMGSSDPKVNPVYAAKSHFLAGLMENARFYADASMGVEGLPQSATGQTAIFTGVNASKVLNRHMSGQPTASLKKIIARDNLFCHLQKMKLAVSSANVYRDEYLQKMMDSRDRRNRPSVTSVMCMAAHVPFRTWESFRNNTGVYHDITGDILRESGYDISPVSPMLAAQNLHTISRNYDLTLFEYFMTDIKGHKADITEATAIIDRLNEFLEALLGLMDLTEDILIITSDHGNIEDMTVKTHTMNKVPVIILGDKAKELNTPVLSLVDIMPMTIELFKRNMNKDIMEGI